MREPRRPEPDLAQFETVALAHQHVFRRHFEAVEFQFAMAAMLFRPHDLDAALDAPAGLILVEQKCREPAPLVVAGARQQDEMRGAVSAGDEPFAAGDDVFAALLLGLGADHRGIGAAAGRRLRHRERRAHFSLDDRLEPFLFLLRRADQLEHVHVAVVGRHAIDRQRAEQATRGFLVDRGPSHYRQVHAAIFLGRLRRPQAGLLRLGAHHGEPVFRNILVLGEIFPVGLERQHLFLDEGAHAQAEVFDVGREREVHVVPSL